MKIMGKVIDKMMAQNDKESFEEMMPALTIKITTDGQATVTKDEDEEEIEEELKDRSPQYLEEKE